MLGLPRTSYRWQQPSSNSLVGTITLPNNNTSSELLEPSSSPPHIKRSLCPPSSLDLQLGMNAEGDFISPFMSPKNLPAGTLLKTVFLEDEPQQTRKSADHEGISSNSTSSDTSSPHASAQDAHISMPAAPEIVTAQSAPMVWGIQPSSQSLKDSVSAQSVRSTGVTSTNKRRGITTNLTGSALKPQRGGPPSPERSANVAAEAGWKMERSILLSRIEGLEAQLLQVQDTAEVVTLQQQKPPHQLHQLHQLGQGPELLPSPVHSEGILSPSRHPTPPASTGLLAGGRRDSLEDLQLEVQLLRVSCQKEEALVLELQEQLRRAKNLQVIHEEQMLQVKDLQLQLSAAQSLLHVTTSKAATSVELPQGTEEEQLLVAGREAKDGEDKVVKEVYQLKDQLGRAQEWAKELYTQVNTLTAELKAHKPNHAPSDIEESERASMAQNIQELQMALQQQVELCAQQSKLIDDLRQQQTAADVSVTNRAEHPAVPQTQNDPGSTAQMYEQLARAQEWASDLFEEVQGLRTVLLMHPAPTGFPLPRMASDLSNESVMPAMPAEGVSESYQAGEALPQQYMSGSQQASEAGGIVVNKALDTGSAKNEKLTSASLTTQLLSKEEELLQLYEQYKARDAKVRLQSNQLLALNDQLSLLQDKVEFQYQHLLTQQQQLIAYRSSGHEAMRGSSSRQEAVQEVEAALQLEQLKSLQHASQSQCQDLHAEREELRLKLEEQSHRSEPLVLASVPLPSHHGAEYSAAAAHTLSPDQDDVGYDVALPVTSHPDGHYKELQHQVQLQQALNKQQEHRIKELQQQLEDAQAAMANAVQDEEKAPPTSVLQLKHLDLPSEMRLRDQLARAQQWCSELYNEVQSLKAVLPGEVAHEQVPSRVILDADLKLSSTVYPESTSLQELELESPRQTSPSWRTIHQVNELETQLERAREWALELYSNLQEREASLAEVLELRSQDITRLQHAEEDAKEQVQRMKLVTQEKEAEVQFLNNGVNALKSKLDELTIFSLPVQLTTSLDPSSISPSLGGKHVLRGAGCSPHDVQANDLEAPVPVVHQEAARVLSNPQQTVLNENLEQQIVMLRRELLQVRAETSRPDDVIVAMQQQREAHHEEFTQLQERLSKAQDWATDLFEEVKTLKMELASCKSSRAVSFKKSVSWKDVSEPGTAVEDESPKVSLEGSGRSPPLQPTEPIIRTGRASVGGSAAAAAAKSSFPGGDAFLIDTIHSLQAELEMGKAQLSRAQVWASELFTQLQAAMLRASLTPVKIEVDRQEDLFDVAASASHLTCSAPEGTAEHPAEFLPNERISQLHMQLQTKEEELLQLYEQYKTRDAKVRLQSDQLLALNDQLSLLQDKVEFQYQHLLTQQQQLIAYRSSGHEAMRGCSSRQEAVQEVEAALQMEQLKSLLHASQSQCQDLQAEREELRLKLEELIRHNNTSHHEASRACPTSVSAVIASTVHTVTSVPTFLPVPTSHRGNITSPSVTLLPDSHYKALQQQPDECQAEMSPAIQEKEQVPQSFVQLQNLHPPSEMGLHDQLVRAQQWCSELYNEVQSLKALQLGKAAEGTSTDSLVNTLSPKQLLTSINSPCQHASHLSNAPEAPESHACCLASEEMADMPGIVPEVQALQARVRALEDQLEKAREWAGELFSTVKVKEASLSGLNQQLISVTEQLRHWQRVSDISTVRTNSNGDISPRDNATIDAALVSQTSVLEDPGITDGYLVACSSFNLDHNASFSKQATTGAAEAAVLTADLSSHPLKGSRPSFHNSDSMMSATSQRSSSLRSDSSNTLLHLRVGELRELQDERDSAAARVLELTELLQVSEDLAADAHRTAAEVSSAEQSLLKKRIQELESEIQDVKATSNEVLLKRVQSQEHLLETGDSFQIMSAELEAVRKQLAAEDELLKQVRKELQSEDRHLVLLKEQLRVEEEQLKEAQQGLKAEEDRLYLVKKQLKDEAEQLVLVRQELQAEDQRLSKLKYQFEAEAGQLSLARQELQAEYQRLSKLKDQLRSESEQLSLARQELQVEDQRLCLLKDELKAEDERLQMAKQELWSEDASLKEIRQELQAEDQQLLLNKAQVQVQCRQLEGLQSEIESKLDELRQRNDSILLASRQDIMTQSINEERLKAEVSRAEKAEEQAAQLRLKVQEMSKALEITCKNFESVQEDADRKCHDLEAVNSQAIKTASDRVAATESALAQALREVEYSNQDAAAARLELRQVEAEAEAEKREVRAAIQHAAAAAAALAETTRTEVLQHSPASPGTISAAAAASSTTTSGQGLLGLVAARAEVIDLRSQVAVLQSELRAAREEARQAARSGYSPGTAGGSSNVSQGSSFATGFTNPIQTRGERTGISGAMPTANSHVHHDPLGGGNVVTSMEQQVRVLEQELSAARLQVKISRDAELLAKRFLEEVRRVADTQALQAVKEAERRAEGGKAAADINLERKIAAMKLEAINSLQEALNASTSALQTDLEALREEAAAARKEVGDIRLSLLTANAKSDSYRAEAAAARKEAGDLRLSLLTANAKSDSYRAEAAAARKEAEKLAVLLSNTASEREEANAEVLSLQMEAESSVALMLHIRSEIEKILSEDVVLMEAAGPHLVDSPADSVSPPELRHLADITASLEVGISEILDKVSGWSSLKSRLVVVEEELRSKNVQVAAEQAVRDSLRAELRSVRAELIHLKGGSLQEYHACKEVKGRSSSAASSSTDVVGGNSAEEERGGAQHSQRDVVVAPFESMAGLNLDGDRLHESEMQKEDAQQSLQYAEATEKLGRLLKLVSASEVHLRNAAEARCSLAVQVRRGEGGTVGTTSKQRAVSSPAPERKQREASLVPRGSMAPYIRVEELVQAAKEAETALLQAARAAGDAAVSESRVSSGLSNMVSQLEVHVSSILQLSLAAQQELQKQQCQGRSSTEHVQQQEQKQQLWGPQGSWEIISSHFSRDASSVGRGQPKATMQYSTAGSSSQPYKTPAWSIRAGALVSLGSPGGGDPSTPAKGKESRWTSETYYRERGEEHSNSTRHDFGSATVFVESPFSTPSGTTPLSALHSARVFTAK
ncbi:hypothetical protein CEUSTIGMA_g10108.t1 [Chlamydomonas eustigma]|uniref:Uncharacterized protein n=1 Tax=Chlamydomonas eustigma TaxID=1157962 RepID=A0A250XIE4_9CHLO|nr:hypothetical protein CEUSTIGMA_g10108.t1 [Chlamydomonas eustigma]|eukprot:GAX82682.1 hypothetical protein CEUSTIGMA_g10108.t1 [Chlamydomonas eustigma]